MTARLITAMSLALLLAACEGNDIPPPSPDPQAEDTVGADDEPVPGDDGATPAETVVAPMEDSQVADITAAADDRAAEILAEVTESDEGRDTVDPLVELEGLVPDTAPLTPSATTTASAEGTLAPSSMLAADTLAAATLAQSGAALAYTGVWAVRGADCELVDQPGFTDFAVITEETMRVQDAMCSISPGPLESGTATVEGQCMIGNTEVPASFTVSLSSAGDLAVTEPSLDVDGRFVRCGLAQ